jgi:hypothetical protein
VDVKIVAAAGIASAIVFLFLGIAGLLPWEIAGTLAATTIGVLGIIIAVERTETGKKDTTIEIPTKPESEGKLLWEESILVTKHSCSHYNFTLDEKEKVTGEVSSDDYFNVYFITPRNFARRENEKEFKYEYGTEHASKMKVNFTPKKPGKFYCIVTNEGEADIDVNVVMYINKIA